MGSEIGVRMRLDVDSSEAESKISHINSLIASDRANNLPQAQNTGTAESNSQNTDKDLFGGTDINAQNNAENLQDISELLKSILRMMKEDGNSNLSPLDALGDPSLRRESNPLPAPPNQSQPRESQEKREGTEDDRKFANTAIRNMNSTANQMNGTVSEVSRGDALGGLSGILTAFGPELVALMGPAGIAAGLGTLAAGLAARGVDKTASIWEGKMGAAMQTQALFSDVSRHDAEENSRQLRQRYNNASSRRFYDDTRFSTEDYISTKNSLAKFGLSESGAERRTSDILQWENSTYADRNLLMQFAGLTSRYGNESDALQTAFNAAKASGLERGQYEEFLNGMLSVVEEGIENGFSKSSGEVAQNLTMLAKLSNENPFWTGEKGARNLSRMDSGMRDATNLNSVEDVMLLRAVMSGGKNTYNPKYGDVSYLMEMEKGVNYDILASMKGQTSSLPADEQIGILKKSFNLSSWSAAAQLFDIMDKIDTPGNDKASIDREIRNANVDNKFDSNEQKMLKYTETIKDSLNGISQSAMDMKTDVASIARFLVPDERLAESSTVPLSEYSRSMVEEAVVAVPDGGARDLAAQEALHGIGDYAGEAIKYMTESPALRNSGSWTFVRNAKSKMKIGDDRKRNHNWFDLLTSEGYGDDDKDRIINESFARAATFRDGDDHIEPHEVEKLFTMLKGNSVVAQSYQNPSVNAEEFKTVIQDALREVFGNEIQFTITR